MGWPRLLAVIGSLEVFIGVFAPVVSLPLLGSANFFGNGQNGTGVVLLMLAGGSVILSFLGKYRALWFTGAGALGVVAFTFITFVTDMSRMAATLNAQLANTPLQGFGSVVAQSLQLEWGWGLLFTGGALLVVAAAWPEAEEDADASKMRTCPECAEDIKAEARVCRFCGSRLESPVPAPLADPVDLGDLPSGLEEVPDPRRVHLLVQEMDTPEARTKLVARLAPYFPGKTPTEIDAELTLPYLIPQRVSQEAAAAVQRKWGEAGIRVQVVPAELLKAGAQPSPR